MIYQSKKYLKQERLNTVLKLITIGLEYSRNLSIQSLHKEYSQIFHGQSLTCSKPPSATIKRDILTNVLRYLRIICI